MLAGCIVSTTAKREVIIYDYADMRVPVLARMAAERRAGYQAIGYKMSGTRDLFPVRRSHERIRVRYGRITDRSGVGVTAVPFPFQIRRAGVVGRSQSILSRRGTARAFLVLPCSTGQG